MHENLCSFAWNQNCFFFFFWFRIGFEAHINTILVSEWRRERRWRRNSQRTGKTVRWPTICILNIHFISFQSVCVSQMNIFPRSSFIQSQLSTKMQMYVWVRRTNVWICTSGICRQHLLEVIEYSSYRYNARNVILFFAQLIDWLCGK